MDKFKGWFSFFNEELDNSIRSNIHIFYDIIKEWGHMLYMICDITFKETKNDVTITIITHRPGLIIGKGGRDIDTLIKYLNDNVKTDKKVIVDLKESKLWKHLNR